ncbi:MAG: phosphate ABC transporter permease PstA [Candidatus Dormibacteria bacterium]
MSLAVERPAIATSGLPMTGAARRIASLGGWLGSLVTLAVAIVLLFSIFGFVLIHGLPALRPSVFTTVTSGVSGGLLNAILGTLLLVAGGLVIVVVLGVGTGVWLAEYAGRKSGALVRFLADVLAGVPSIVIGYFGYVLFVVSLGWGFSLAAGAIALALIMLPYVIRGTDLALGTVPRQLREAGFALGARSRTVLFSISFPYALPGMLTGLLLATSIALGETAPLIYTAGWSNYLPTLAPTHSPVGYLTYVVWSFISQPFEASHQLAYAAATILIVFIFLVNIAARSALDGVVRRMRING